MESIKVKRKFQVGDRVKGIIEPDWVGTVTNVRNYLLDVKWDHHNGGAVGEDADNCRLLTKLERALK